MSLATSPLHVFFGLAVLALILKIRGRTRPAMWTIVSATLLLWSSSTPFVATTLLRQLERPWPPVAPEAAQRADAIVLLGGYLGSTLPPRITPDFTDASDRLIHAARLHRAGRAPLLITTGGNVSWSGVRRSEAEEAAGLLVEFGVPAASILVEGRSVSTRENAEFTAALCREKGIRKILLVTSASHMTRARAVFARTGLDVLPAATDYSALDGAPRPWILGFWPDISALEGSEAALHEFAGLLYYRVRGWL